DGLGVVVGRFELRDPLVQLGRPAGVVAGQQPLPGWPGVPGGRLLVCADGLTKSTKERGERETPIHWMLPFNEDRTAPLLERFRDRCSGSRETSVDSGPGSLTTSATPISKVL